AELAERRVVGDGVHVLELAVEVVAVAAVGGSGAEVGQRAERMDQPQLLLDLADDVDVELSRDEVTADAHIELPRFNLLACGAALDKDVTVAANHPYVHGAVPVAVAVHRSSRLPLTGRASFSIEDVEELGIGARVASRGRGTHGVMIV